MVTYIHGMKAPAASRRILVLVAGIVWSLVGVALTLVALIWSAAGIRASIPLLVAGLVLGWLVYRYGFSRLVKKNLLRIYEQAPGKEKVCIFAFQNMRSYFIIIMMMGFGYVLRHLPIGKIYIAPIYLMIGVALLLSSLGYYSDFAERR